MSQKRFKYLLIDLDGTLTDSKVGIQTCIRYALAKVGYPLDEQFDLDWTIGPSLRGSFAKILNTQDEQLVDQVIQFYRERFSTIGLYENDVYAQVPETLNALHAQGYQLFVATAKPTIYARQILEHFQLSQYFIDIYGSELSGERSDKGELIAYLLQTQQLNPADGVMVGDRDCDIKGARHNQMQAIAACYGYGTDLEIAEAQPLAKIYQFNELLDILALLEGLLKPASCDVIAQ